MELIIKSYCMKTLPENTSITQLNSDFCIVIQFMIYIKSYCMKTLPENPLVHSVYAELLNHMHACTVNDIQIIILLYFSNCYCIH